MIEAVVASGKIETGSVGEAIVECLTCRFIERFVAVAPFAVEPRGGFSGIEMPKDRYRPNIDPLCNRIIFLYLIRDGKTAHPKTTPHLWSAS